jgi:hypothetical protein
LHWQGTWRSWEFMPLKTSYPEICLNDMFTK